MTANVSGSTVLTTWPQRPGKKVPSEYSYDPSKHRQWGFDIDEDSHRMVWTKLEFDQHTRRQELQLVLNSLRSMSMLRNYNRKAGPLPPYPGYEPVKVATDYLTEVREHVKSDLERIFQKDVLNSLHIEFVVTVPAVSARKMRHSL